MTTRHHITIGVFDGPLIEGEYRLGIKALLKGYGYGVFSYVNSYRFEIDSTYRFTVPPKRRVSITAIAYETCGPTSDRPRIRYDEVDGAGIAQAPTNPCSWKVAP